MKYYLSTWGQVDGDFQPVGTQGLNGWTCIDFRPDSTVADGFCLVAAPDAMVVSGATLVASSSGEVLSTARKRSLSNGIGLNLAASRFDEIALELLTVHASDTDATRWNRLRPAFGRHEVWLGNQKIVDLPVVGGGAVYTDTFNVADVSPMTTADLTWGNPGPSGDTFKIVSNELQPMSTGARWNRCEHDCATNDVYAQIAIASSDTTAGSRWGAVARYQSGADTGYMGRQGSAAAINDSSLTKNVTSVLTSLGTSTNTKATNEVVKVTANGSTITLLFDGVSNISVTDTAITTGTRGGVYVQVATSVSRGAMDNFSMGDITSLVYRPRDRRRAAVWRASYW